MNVKLVGAGIDAKAGKLGGKVTRNYYEDRPWVGLLIAVVSAASIIVGAILVGTVGAIIGALLAIIVGLLPPTITKVRETEEW